MIQPFNAEFFAPTKKLRRLSILLSIHNVSEISQHQIGRITHLSSSMVNNYIKELRKDESISVAGNTNRTRRYHLTAKGRDELLSLLLAYSAEIIRLYGGAKGEIGRRLRQIRSDGIRTVALFGAAYTAEVVYAVIKEIPLEVVAVVDSDPKKQGKPFGDLIIQPPDILKKVNVDAVVITSFGKQEEIHDSIRRFVDKKIRVVKLSNL